MLILDEFMPKKRAFMPIYTQIMSIYVYVYVSTFLLVYSAHVSHIDIPTPIF